MDKQPTEIEQARTSRQIVLQAITTICEHNAYANRASVTRLSGLSQVIVDDHIKKLKADDIIRMDVPGFYYPVDQSVDRPVSTTGLSFGRVKIEVGDELLELNPREAYALAKQISGLLFAFKVAHL